jgi:hypothetical protein
MPTYIAKHISFLGWNVLLRFLRTSAHDEAMPISQPPQTGPGLNFYMNWDTARTQNGIALAVWVQRRIRLPLKAKERDIRLMTKEKYEIHYNGQMGDFVGRVFNFTRGQRVFDRDTHPELFQRTGDVGGSDRNLLRIPDGWTVEGSVDTGTFYTALLMAFSPEGEAFVIDEFPNYRYLAGTAERDESLSIPKWASNVSSRALQVGGKTSFWADANSQFKGELRNYGIHLLPARVPVEARTEIAREYFEHNRVWIAPWVTVLPFELENAAWPEEASLSGKFSRVKDRDHTLDCLEHLLARRPFGRVTPKKTYSTWAESAGLKPIRPNGNRHLGKF